MVSSAEGRDGSSGVITVEKKEDIIMAYSRVEVPELENLLKYGKKKFVRYDECAR